MTYAIVDERISQEEHHVTVDSSEEMHSIIDSFQGGIIEAGWSYIPTEIDNQGNIVEVVSKTVVAKVIS